MPAPPDKFRPRNRVPISPADRQTTLWRRRQRELDIRLLTEERDKLVAEMRRLGIPLPERYRDAKTSPVPCRLHGVPWTECNLCSKSR